MLRGFLVTTDIMQLFLHWLVTVIILVAPPAGPAYNFITDLYTVSLFIKIPRAVLI